MDVELINGNGGTGSTVLCSNFIVSKENNDSIRNVVGAAQRLADRYFESDIELRTTKAYSSISGTSWELMLGLGLASLLSGIPLRAHITGSGVIDERGNIAPVVGIPQKIRAAKEAGFTMFLVSQDQQLRAGESADASGMHVIGVKDIKQAWFIAANAVPWELRS